MTPFAAFVFTIHFDFMRSIFPAESFVQVFDHVHSIGRKKSMIFKLERLGFGGYGFVVRAFKSPER